MPRTSTAEQHDYLCPLCGRELARDYDRRGWVRHQAKPDVAGLLADPGARRMMSEADAEYLAVFGLCPLERGQKDDVDPLPPRFLHLEPRQGSNYRQWFLKGTRTRAESIYRELLGPDYQTPEQVAEDCGLPVEAVREAIEYCEHNEELLHQERERDLADIEARGLGRPPLIEIGRGPGR